MIRWDYIHETEEAIWGRRPLSIGCYTARASMSSSGSNISISMISRCPRQALGNLESDVLDAFGVFRGKQACAGLFLFFGFSKLIPRSDLQATLFPTTLKTRGAGDQEKRREPGRQRSPQYIRFLASRCAHNVRPSLDLPQATLTLFLPTRFF